MTRYDLENTNSRVREYADPIPSATPSKNRKRKKRKKANLAAPIALVLGLLLSVSAIVFGIYLFRNYTGTTSAAQSASADTAALSDTGSENEIAALSQNLSTDTSEMQLTDVSDIVADAMPSVVSITSRTKTSGSDFMDFFYSTFGGADEESQEEVDSGIGSGTIIGKNDTELLILTSYHVVEDCSSLYVTFNDDTSVDGTVKAAATSYDIAVVSVPLADIPESTMSQIKIAQLCTDDVQVGEGVIVIGDALGYGQSVVTGIISAVDREITVEDTTIKVLQTDAAINAGNSGGCMLNSKGEIIGISEAKITDSSVEGMCYALPIKDNYNLIQMLMTGEYNDLQESDYSSAEADYLYGGEDEYSGSYTPDMPGQQSPRMF